MSSDLQKALTTIGIQEVQIQILTEALEDSVTLQSHYAELLNAWDDGRRMTFPNAKAWLDRLAQTGQLSKKGT